MFSGGGGRGDGGGRRDRNSHGGGEERASGHGQRALGGEEAQQSSQDESGSSQGTDFSVHRLLPPPSVAFAPPPHQLQLHPLPSTNEGQQRPHSTTLVSPDSSEQHILQQEASSQFAMEPLGGPQPWVGYGSPYQSCPSLPTYTNNHLLGPLPGEQRWPNQLYPPHPMPSVYVSVPPSSPFQEPPTTPGHQTHLHHEHGGSGSPENHSPHPDSHSGMSLHDPANAGLYTLCQAAMMSSSLPENSPYPTGYNLPHSNGSHLQQAPSLQPDVGLPSRPPPPYLHFYSTRPTLSLNPGANLSTIPHSSTAHPAPPGYHMIHQQTQMIMNNHTPQPISSPSFIGSAPTNTLVQDSEQPFTLDQQKMGHTEMGASQHLIPIISEQPAMEGSAVSTQQAVSQLSYSLQQSSISHEQPHSSTSPASSSSLMHQIPPPSIVQDGEQPGPSHLHSITDPLCPYTQLPSEQQSQSIPNSSPVPSPSFVDSLPPRGVAAGDESGLPPPYREQPDSGSSGGNAGQPEEEEEGLVATLATANAVVEGMDIESERDSHSDIPNHAPLDPPEPSLSLPLPARRRTKRTRTAFSQSQLDALELAFHANPYPDGFYRQKVSRHVGIAEDRIQVWFQNRRARGKKQSRTGSVSQRSQVREERLKRNLASIARQAAIMAATTAQRFGALQSQSQSLSVPQPPDTVPQMIHIQQQPHEIEQQHQPREIGQQHQPREIGQQQQQQELQNEQMETQGDEGLSQHHQQLEPAQSLPQELQQQLEPHQNSGREAGGLQQRQAGVSGPSQLSSLLLQTPSPAAPLASSTGADDPLPPHSDPISTLPLQPPVVFNSHSSTICYFPHHPGPSHPPPPHNPLLQHTQQTHSMYIFPTTLTPPLAMSHSHPPVPPIPHLHPPNPLFYSHSSSLQPNQHQQHQQHLTAGGGGGSSASSPGPDTSSPVTAANRSHSAPSSLSAPTGSDTTQALSERAGQSRERLSSHDPQPSPDPPHQ